MRARRPELFSDSVPMEECVLSDHYLNFILDSITTFKQEQDFEYFCRCIVQRVICPNLTYQTGPTGGGDRKVDCETYPVADEIAERWYTGIDGASKERWGFAFSAKKDWRSKLNDDIQKAIDTGRNYSKLYFVTNQPVRDKVGAEEEDELSVQLSEQYKTRVIVLDRLWLADTVKSRKLWELVFDCLHIDRPPATKQLSIGPLDLERKRELDKLDESVSDSSRYQFSKHQLIEDCLQAARLARGLGHDRKEIDGRFSQCTRLARKHGTPEQLIRVLFDQCWTEAFWFDDLSNVDRIYDEIEPLALDSYSVWMCDTLVHLHSIGNCCRITTPEAYNRELWEQRRARLCDVLRGHAANDSKPTSALYASTQLLIDRLIYRTSGNETDPLSSILTDLKNILQDARHHLDYPFWLVSEIIQIAGQFVEDDESFENLVDVIVEWRNDASSASERGRIWLERGMSNLDDEKPYQAIDQLARACSLFAKDESSGELGYALVGLAMAYEAVDLLWAARAFYLAAAHQRLAYYAKEGRPDPGAFALRYQLAELEIRLGRPTCALTLFTLMMEALTHSNSVEELRKQLEDKIPTIDVNLGVLCLRTREVDLPYLEHLPAVFRTMQLSAPRGCLLFALGYDDQFCTEFEFEDDVDEFFRDLMISSEFFEGSPEWHCGSRFSYSTRILGCRIVISGANRIEQILLAESILGFLEAAAATMVLDQTNLAVNSEVKIEIQTSNRKNRFVTSKVVHGVGGNALIEVKCPKHLPSGSETEHFRSLSLVALEALSLILGVLNEFTLDKLKVTITQQCHWTAMTPLMVSNLLSSTEGYFPKSWKDPSKPERFELKEPKANILRQAMAAKPRSSSGLPYPLHREQVPLLIHPVMWQEADLCYAGYGFETETSENPLLILLFRNFALGCSIFASCKAALGDSDIEERLRLALILGVDPDMPTHYRIAIREERDGKQLGPLMVLPVKSDSVSNRDKFIESVRHGGLYKVLPGTTVGDSAVNVEPKLAIVKSKIRIVQACEIGTDDPDYDAMRPISESKHVKDRRISPLSVRLDI